jgi:hypothetical protein
MRAKLFVAAIIGLTGPANAQSSDVYSANYVLPGCMEALGSAAPQSFASGYCVGIVRVIVNLGPIFGVCPPPTAPAGQAVRVVVAYINQNPARMHEAFELLAIEAFRNAWPCRK